MSLTAGTRLGPYEILSAIGRGGMGQRFLLPVRDQRQAAVPITVVLDWPAMVKK